MKSEVIDALIRGFWVLPYICIWVAGLIICFNFHKKSPLAANFAIAGFVIFILASVFSFAAQAWAMSKAADDGYASMQVIFSSIGILSTSLNILGWVILLVALVNLFKGGNNQ